MSKTPIQNRKSAQAYMDGVLQVPKDYCKIPGKYYKLGLKHGKDIELFNARYMNGTETGDSEPDSDSQKAAEPLDINAGPSEPSYRKRKETKP